MIYGFDRIDIEIDVTPNNLNDTPVQFIIIISYKYFRFSVESIPDKVINY